MTLAKERLKIGSSAEKPGVLFTALTRIRHPDTLMLDDQFPSYSQIMKVRSHPSFELRQRWERKLRAKFSRTVRRHMRDPQEYAPDSVWTAEDSDLADSLLRFLDPATTDLDSVPELYLQQHAEACGVSVHRVWARLQQFPHCFEVAEKRGTLQTLRLDGTVDPSPVLSQEISSLKHAGWEIRVPDALHFADRCVLCPSVLEFLAHALRARIDPATMCFFAHGAVKRSKGVAPHEMVPRPETRNALASPHVVALLLAF